MCLSKLIFYKTLIRATTCLCLVFVGAGLILFHITCQIPFLRFRAGDKPLWRYRWCPTEAGSPCSCPEKSSLTQKEVASHLLSDTEAHMLSASLLGSLHHCLEWLEDSGHFLSYPWKCFLVNKHRRGSNLDCDMTLFMAISQNCSVLFMRGELGHVGGPWASERTIETKGPLAPSKSRFWSWRYCLVIKYLSHVCVALDPIPSTVPNKEQRRPTLNSGSYLSWYPAFSLVLALRSQCSESLSITSCVWWNDVLRLESFALCSHTKGSKPYLGHD